MNAGRSLHAPRPKPFDAARERSRCAGARPLRRSTVRRALRTIIKLSRVGELCIGTSGYVYRDWRGLLYPPRIPASRWLARYAEVFRTVELNATFYRLPELEAVRCWRRTTPTGFVFAAKGSRFLTHMKKLTDVDVGLGRFLERVAPLGRKLAVVLWQLPPHMRRADPERLARFLDHLPRRMRHAFEFRDAAWYTEEVCTVLDAYGAAFVEHDLVPRAPPRATGGFRYLRFHGTTGRYDGRYGARALAHVARELVSARRRGDVFVYFNNDRHGHALYDALDLARLTGAPLGPQPGLFGSTEHAEAAGPAPGG